MIPIVSIAIGIGTDFHLASVYINLIQFLNHPEKAWSEQNNQLKKQPDLFNSG